MKKSTITSLIVSGITCVLAVLFGYTLAKSEQPIYQFIETVKESTISNTKQSERNISETMVPPASEPEWYNQAKNLISDFQDQITLAQNQNTTFNIAATVNELENAIQLMARYNQDNDMLLIYSRQMLYDRGYPTDNPNFVEDLITRAFHSAGWQVAPNEEGFTQSSS
ncbi:hypothetical protein [Enterococcus casseliflavus]|uniref:hypothetical protein n=1 Tax=Enterococcus casseliflavus TaxID=37734 RepID=UPI0034D22E6C